MKLLYNGNVFQVHHAEKTEFQLSSGDYLLPGGFYIRTKEEGRWYHYDPNAGRLVRKKTKREVASLDRNAGAKLEGLSSREGDLEE